MIAANARHFWRAAVGVFTARKQIVHGIDGVRLDGVVGGEHQEHGCFRLEHASQPAVFMT